MNQAVTTSQPASQAKREANVMPVEPIDLSIEQVIAHFGDLSTLAPVAVEVIRLAEDDDASLVDIADVISSDPGLTVRLLRLANTPAYSRGNEVTNLQTAAGLLGIHTLKMVTLGFTLVADLSAEGPETSLIWRRALASAVLARSLASGTHPELADDAFVAGLLSNIGKLALFEQPAYADLLPTIGLWLTPEQEQALTGFTSDEVTARILTGWQLPGILAESIRYRHSSEPQAAVTPLAGILRLADDAARLLLVADPTDRAQAVDALTTSAARSGHTIGDIKGLISDLAPQLDEIASTFEFEAITRIPVDEIVRDAQAQLARLGMDLASMLSAAQERNVALAALNKQLENEASTDALTGLPNRRTFDSYLANQVGGRQRNSRTTMLGLVVFDLDHFKSINDSFGHAVGDEVLAEFGHRLQGSVRRGELAARIGGEEFALVMPDIANLSELTGAAERIRALIGGEPVRTEIGPLVITTSVGGAVIRTIASDSAEVLFRTADKALYAAKEGGRDRVETVLLG